jgi:hypothetical protein
MLGSESFEVGPEGPRLHGPGVTVSALPGLIDSDEPVAGHAP